MITPYEQYLEDKESGCLVEWDSLTKEDLFDLYCKSMIVDSIVAKLFDVSVNKVRYARKKHGITQKLISIYQLMNENERKIQWDEEAKTILISDQNADSLAIGLTHLCFRNGPVEDMHANGQLSENDMMILNKYMVNHIATLLYLLKNNMWVELHFFLKYDMKMGLNWDKPEIQLFEVYKSMELNLELGRILEAPRISPDAPND